MIPKVAYGIVAMIDALGIKNLTISDSQSFIEDLNKVVEHLNVKKKRVQEVAKELGVNSTPELIIFGDTLLFAWDISSDANPYRFLPLWAEWIRSSILAGIGHNLLFRGAFTIGEYIIDFDHENNKTVLVGPAIADVASWYEEADWIGIIATPTCNNHISAIESKVSNIEAWFVKYDVPIKKGILKDNWVVSWPAQMLINSNAKEIEESISFYYDLIRQYTIPKGTESKYFNTEIFLKHFINKYKNKFANRKKGANKK